MDGTKCQHLDFNCFVTVNRLEDIGRFSADVEIECKACGVPFRFIGLPAGVDLNGAAVWCDDGMNFVESEQQAIDMATNAIAECRDASDEEWIDDVNHICYGLVIGESRCKDTGDYYDFTIEKCGMTPAALAERVKVLESQRAELLMALKSWIGRDGVWPLEELAEWLTNNTDATYHIISKMEGPQECQNQ